MKEFFPGQAQQDGLTAEMHKLTKKHFGRAALSILVGGIILGVLYFVVVNTERSMEARDTSAVLSALGVVGFLFVSGLSIFVILFGIWLILHGIYSKNKDFTNYRYYICTVVGMEFIRRVGPSARSRTPSPVVFYVSYNMDGNKKRIQVEGGFYDKLEIGGEFIMAKSKGGTLLLPSIFME